jgi:hypothetical protein
MPGAFGLRSREFSNGTFFSLGGQKMCSWVQLNAFLRAFQLRALFVLQHVLINKHREYGEKAKQFGGEKCGSLERRADMS